jgi:hypothetical protein
MENDQIGQISVKELKDYWAAVENLKPGERLDKYYGTREMPSWQELCLELDWHLYAVTGGYFARKHTGYCGVYRLIALSSDEDVLDVAFLDRACGHDLSGTLYIGEAKWLNERLNQMRRSFEGEDSHGASSLWRQSSALRLKFPLKRLGIALLFTGVGMHRIIERDLIRAYLNSFGDTPPLNCSY